MNYVSVVMAGTGLFIVVAWWVPGGKRKTFTGPRIGKEGLEVLSAVNRGEVGRVSLERIGELEGTKA